MLQFEVIQSRLKSEYRVAVGFDRLPFHLARWIESGDGTPLNLDKFELSGRTTCVLDIEDRPLILFDSEWLLQMAERDNPKVRFIAAVQPGRSARGGT